MMQRHETSMTADRLRRRNRPRGFTLLELVIVIGVILVLMSLVLGVGSIVVAQSETRQLDAVMKIVDSSLAEFEAQTGRPIVFQGGTAANRYDHCGYGAATYDGINSGFYYDVPYLPYRDDRFADSIENGGFGWTENSTCPPWQDSAGFARRQWMAATLSILAQNPTCAEMLAKADPTLLHNAECIAGSDGSILALDIKELVDPWGKQVYIVFPGRPFQPGDASSTAGIEGQEGVRDPDGTIRTREELQYGICRNGRPLLVSSGPDSLFGDLREADPSGADFVDAQDNIYSYEPDQP